MNYKDQIKNEGKIFKKLKKLAVFLEAEIAEVKRVCGKCINYWSVNV